MSRMFRVGDKVKAFLDSRISGRIVAIHQVQATQWLAEGTSSIEFFVDVKTDSGKIIKIKMSELMHDDL